MEDGVKLRRENASHTLNKLNAKTSGLCKAKKSHPLVDGFKF